MSLLKWLPGALGISKREAVMQIGDVAPEFTLQDHEGKTVSLTGLRGKSVVLWFYPKADTPG